MLGLRLGELVGGELVGELDVVVLVGGGGGLEVDHRRYVVELSDEVDDADEGGANPEQTGVLCRSPAR